MDHIAQDLEDYRSAVSVLTIDELVAIGQAQIAAENAWQARLAGGFANRLLEATMSRQNTDFASLLSSAELRQGRRSALPESVDEPEAAIRAQAFLAADGVFRAIARRSAGTNGELPELDEHSETVDIVIAYALKALGSALLAFQHRDCLSEADFAFLVGPYALVIGGRTAGGGLS